VPNGEELRRLLQQYRRIKLGFGMRIFCWNQWYRIIVDEREHIQWKYSMITFVGHRISHGIWVFVPPIHPRHHRNPSNVVPCVGLAFARRAFALVLQKAVASLAGS
jgi:hypothetical protein